VAQAQAALAGEHVELRDQRIQHLGQRKIPQLRHQSTRFQPRHVQQPGPAGRWWNPARRRSAGRARAARHRRAAAPGVREQVRGMQRLQQVVADRGEEAALGVVGALGLALGGLEHRGAFADALLERFVDALEAGLGLAERGDVGEGGDEAPARHRVAADFHDAPVREHAFRQVRGAGTHMRQPALQGGIVIVHVAERTQRPLRCLGDRHAHPQHAGRVAEQFGVAAIPCHQPQLAHRPR
jgi:hypothetical protein